MSFSRLTSVAAAGRPITFSRVARLMPIHWSSDEKVQKKPAEAGPFAFSESRPMNAGRQHFSVTDTPNKRSARMSRRMQESGKPYPEGYDRHNYR